MRQPLVVHQNPSRRIHRFLPQRKTLTMNCPLSRNKKTPVRSVEKYFYDQVTLQKIKNMKLKHKDLNRTIAIDIVCSKFSTQSFFNTHSLATKNIKGLKLKFTQPSRTSHLAIQLPVTSPSNEKQSNSLSSHSG